MEAAPGRKGFFGSQFRGAVLHGEEVRRRERHTAGPMTLTHKMGKAMDTCCAQLTPPSLPSRVPARSEREDAGPVVV